MLACLAAGWVLPGLRGSAGPRHGFCLRHSSRTSLQPCSEPGFGASARERCPTKLCFKPTDAPLPPLAWPGFAVPLVPGVATSCLAALGDVMDAMGWQWGLQDRSKPDRLVLLSCDIMPSQMAPWVDIERRSLGWMEHTNMCFPGDARASFLARRRISRLPPPSVLHPWLLSDLAELSAAELGTPSPRHEPLALLCRAFQRGTGGPLIADR